MHKTVGSCTVCDEPVFEILTVYPNDHPLAGEPRSVGRPLDNALRATLVLTDGSTIDLTHCEDCELDLPHIWQKCLATFTYEDRTRVERGAQPMTEVQRQNHRDQLVRLAAEIPLGLLYTRKWIEIGDISKA